MTGHADVLSAIRRIIRATDLRSKQLEKETALTSPQLLVLQTLLKQGPMTISLLAADISLSQGTVSSILDRLEGKQLVARQKDAEDKRRVNVVLTAAGKAAAESAPMPLQAEFVARFDALEDWEQTMILAALQRVAGMMDATDLDASPLLEIGSLS